MIILTELRQALLPYQDSRMWIFNRVETGLSFFAPGLPHLILIDRLLVRTRISTCCLLPLADPCNKHSQSAACTGDGAYSYRCAKAQSCATVTPFRDSRIHSRVKRAVGARAAHAVSALLYGSPRPAAGPVIAGCHVDTARPSPLVPLGPLWRKGY